MGGISQFKVNIPSDITGLTLWLDANDLTTITKDGSDRVENWSDKSSSGFSAAQTTEVDKPLYVATGFNGKPSIYFNASNTEYMALGVSDFPITSQLGYTVIIVGNVTGNAQNWLSNWASPGDAVFFGRNSNNYRMGDGWNNTGVPCPLTDEVHVHVAKPADARIYNGKTLVGARGSNAFDATAEPLLSSRRWYVGLQGTWGEYLTGDIAEIVVYDKWLGEGDIESLYDNYFYPKWGV